MFESLTKAPADKIFQLVAQYKADDRAEKLDLGIGVYKDANGNTPIMSAVKKAEEIMLKNQNTKTYVGVPGNAGFRDAVADLVFGDAIENSRLASVQAPGGTGALWVLMQLINRAKDGAKVYVSDPTWPNHVPMLKNVGLAVETYPYFDPKTRAVRFAEMLKTLDQMQKGDVVLLHACCHNPTGANLTPSQWDDVADSLKRTGALPFLDLAYQGFGDGLESDVYGVRKIAQTCDEVLLAFSASKNFALYRERAGVSFVLSKSADAAAIAASQMGNIVRSSYSQSPDHGAEIVRLILTTTTLRAEWEDELTQMRKNMLELREKLASELRRASNSVEFDFIAEHRGMFSLLGIPVEEVEALRSESAVYMIDDSRMNIAGLPREGMDKLANAITSVRK